MFLSMEATVSKCASSTNASIGFRWTSRTGYMENQCNQLIIWCHWTHRWGLFLLDLQIYLREIVAVFFLSLFWRGVVEWEACPTYIYILSFCPKNNQTKAWKRQKRVCQLYHSSPNKHVEKSTVIPDKERGCRRDSEVIRVGPAACCCCLISGMALTGDSLILDYYV